MKIKLLFFTFAITVLALFAMITPNGVDSANLAYCANNGVCLGTTQLDIYPSRHCNNLCNNVIGYRTNVSCTSECDTIPDSVDMVASSGTICYKDNDGACRTVHAFSSIQNCCTAGTAPIPPSPTEGPPSNPPTGSTKTYVLAHEGVFGKVPQSQCKAYIISNGKSGCIGYRVYVDGTALKYGPICKDGKYVSEDLWEAPFNLKQGGNHRIGIEGVYTGSSGTVTFWADGTNQMLECSASIPTATPCVIPVAPPSIGFDTITIPGYTTVYWGASAAATSYKIYIYIH